MDCKIAVFPGDGVGPELIAEGMRVLDKAAELDKFKLEWIEYPHSAEHYLETKETLSGKTLAEIKSSCKVIYSGTFDQSNGQKIPATIRNYFSQFISLRPIKLMPTVESPLSIKEDIDFVIIRENFEDFYIDASGRAKNGKTKQQLEIDRDSFKARFGLNIEAKGDIAFQIGVLSKKSCDNISRFAFEYAKVKSRSKVTAIDKANVLQFHNLLRESIENTSKNYSEIKLEFEIVDSAVINFVREPQKYDIILAPNMIGDILSDLGTALQGNLAFACRGNINPDGISMFEPVHGCASKYKGKGIINPIATIWAGALMLDSLGLQKSAELVVKAIEGVLKENRTRTHDLNGNNSTSEMGDAIVDKLVEIHD